jgi:protein-S-isoprenylcysteine O-methyltransferase Ste14
MTVLLMIIAPALAIFLACLGLETLENNLMGWFLLAIGIAYPAGIVIYYFIRHEPFWRSRDRSGIAWEEKNDLSFWVILPGFLVTFFASPLEWLFLPAILPRTIWMQIIGVIFILMSLGLRIWVRRTIRNQYTGHLEIQKDQTLVKSGPYRYVRHPGYTGFLLMTLGVAIGYSSLIGLIAIPILLLPGLAYRMRIEEKLLIAQFGDEYKSYSSQTKKLIPLIW